MGGDIPNLANGVLSFDAIYSYEAGVQSKTKDVFPPIGSVPLMPMNELVNPFGARSYRADRLYFCTRYADPGGLRDS